MYLKSQLFMEKQLFYAMWNSIFLQIQKNYIVYLA